MSAQPSDGRRLGAAVMQKMAVLVSSASGFLFTLLLARFWPADHYAEFVADYSLVSYLAFPFVFGLIPYELRRVLGRSAMSMSATWQHNRSFLLLYLAAGLLVIGFWTPNLLQAIQATCIWIMILMLGIWEAVLRDRGAMNAVFNARALGMIVSVGVLLLVMLVDAPRTGCGLLWLRIVPSLLWLGAMLWMWRHARPVASVPVQDEAVPGIGAARSGWLGILDASLVTMTVGVFQYVLLIVGKDLVALEQFVGLSINLMISVTVCQRLMEPHVFRLYVPQQQNRHGDTPRAAQGRQVILALELILAAALAQVVAGMLLGKGIDWQMVSLFSVGSAAASFAHHGHTALFLRRRSLKVSMLVLTIFVGILTGLATAGRGLGFPQVYLAMALVYLVAVRFAHQRSNVDTVADA